MGRYIDDLLISDLFTHTNSTSFNAFTVHSGWHIGDFAAEFGIDIVLSSMNPTIAEARAGDNFIIADQANNLAGEALISNREKKEAVIGYYDICNFFSLNYVKNGLCVKNSTDSDFRVISPASDPNEEMASILSKFNNANKLTIDIRNEHNLSFNFYGNIDVPIKYAINSSSYSDISYPQWPLLRLAFTPTSSDYVNLMVPAADITNARAYYRKNNTKLPVFKPVIFSNNYSKKIQFKFSKTPGGLRLPSFHNLMFLREIDQNYLPTEWAVKSYHFVDNLFDVEKLIYTDNNVDLNIWGGSQFEKPTRWKINEQQSFVDLTDRHFLAKTATAEDAQNLYFFAFSNGDSIASSSVDLDMITGESEKGHFFDEVLLPKYNNTLSVISYELDVNGNSLYILKDNINSRGDSDFIKLVPNKRDFILIALDKASSVPLLTNAYIQFQNNLPKRLVLRNRQQITTTEGAQYWEADIALVGYGNNTTTGNFEIKEINTAIKVYFHDENQKIFGTNNFNANYVVGDLEQNASDIYGFIFKNVRYNLRNVPSASNPSAVVLGQTGRQNLYFKVLAKYENPTYSELSDSAKKKEDAIWYYIELIDEVIDWSDETKIVPVGTRCFVNKKAAPHLITRFGRFIRMLTEVNSQLDLLPDSANDTLEQRVTRLRQRGHNANVDLFNDVIGKEEAGAIYLDQIPEAQGKNISMIFFQGTNDEMTVDLNLGLQLYLDIASVEFSNSQAVEIQHLFVGLDVIGNLRTNFTIYFGIIPIDISHNVHTSLHCGDAGAIPTNVLDYIDDEPEKGKDSYLAIKERFESDPASQKRLFPLEERYYRHCQDLFFPLMDQYGDFYSFGLHSIMNQYNMIFSGNSLANTSGSHLVSIFETFNEDIKLGEFESISNFFSFFNAPISFPILADNVNLPLYWDMIDYTYEFSKLWRLNQESGVENITQSEKGTLYKYSKRSILEYIDFINRFRKKYIN